MGTPSVLIRKSTQEIIKHADYPREDMEPVIGLDPDLEWLVKYEPYIQPDYDNRVYNMNMAGTITTTPHPDYPDLNQYSIAYSIERKDDNEILELLDNIEAQMNETIIPIAMQLKYLSGALECLFKIVRDSATLTTKQEKIVTTFRTQAVKILKNHTNKLNKKSTLLQGTLPTLDDNWDTNNFIEIV